MIAISQIKWTYRRYLLNKILNGIELQMIMFLWIDFFFGQQQEGVFSIWTTVYYLILIKKGIESCVDFKFTSSNTTYMNYEDVNKVRFPLSWILVLEIKRSHVLDSSWQFLWRHNRILMWKMKLRIDLTCLGREVHTRGWCS